MQSHHSLNIPHGQSTFAFSLWCYRTRPRYPRDKNGVVLERGTIGTAHGCSRKTEEVKAWKRFLGKLIMGDVGFFQDSWLFGVGFGPLRALPCHSFLLRAFWAWILWWGGGHTRTRSRYRAKEYLRREREGPLMS